MSSIVDCPGFVAAFDADQSQIISCHDPSGKLTFISSSVDSILGFSIEDLLGSSDYQLARSGGIHFRPHKNGDSVKFQNTFWSESGSGDIYSIDKVVVDSLPGINGVAQLLVGRNGDIMDWRCDDSRNFGNSLFEVVVGQSITSLCDKSDCHFIMDAIKHALRGTSFFGLHTHWLRNCSPRSYEITPVNMVMDFHRRLDAKVIVCLRPLGSGISSRSRRGSDCTTSSEETATSASHDDLTYNEETTHNQSFLIDRYNRELEAEIQYLRDFRDNATVPMYSINSNLEIIWANDAMAEMMGYGGEKDKYVGSATKQYHVDQELVQRMIDTVASGGILQATPCKVRRKDGTVLDVTYDSSAHFDNNGVFTHSRCIVQDVTERNRLQREKAQFLKQKLAAETSEAAAVLASQLKSRFLATMTHEIRTPINGVIGAASLLAITDLNEEQEDYVATINASADVLLALVHNILDFTKIESGHLQMDNVPICFADIVRQSSRVMLPRATEKGIRLVTTVDPLLSNAGASHCSNATASSDSNSDTSNLRGGAEGQGSGRRWHISDPTRLKQVLLNFLSNAVKFTSEGGVECRVSLISSEAAAAALKQQQQPTYTTASSATGSAEALESKAAETAGARGEEERECILVEVVDTGIGIEDCSVLFADFVQATSKIHQTYGGTGLGLSISKKIVEHMGGAVGIESQIGRGTRVWATFQLTPACNPNPNVTSTPSQQHHTQPQQQQAHDAPSEGVATRMAGAEPDSSGNTCITCTSSSPAPLPVPPPPLLPQPATAANGNGRQTRVLIAEDNKVNQKVVKRMLETLGYADLQVVENGQQAVEAVSRAYERGCPFDVVLMDCQMPVMDGLEATRQIRRFEQSHHPTMRATVDNNDKESENVADGGGGDGRKDTSSNQTTGTGTGPDGAGTGADTGGTGAVIIIALTANATVEDEKTCLAAGMDAFCVKPITRDRMGKVMAQWTVAT